MESGIVGYSNIPVAKGWAFKTVIFKNIGGNEIDLTQLSVKKTNGDEYGVSGISSLKANGFVIQKMDTDGMYLDEYHYITCVSGSGAVGEKGWYKGGTEFVKADEVKLNDGEGIIINTTKADAAILMSGEVDLVCKTTIAKGWNFSGNNTPVSFKLNDMSVKKTSGDEYGVSGISSLKANGFVIQKMDTDGMYLAEYHYITCVSGSGAVEKKGWYKNGTTFVEDGSEDNLTFDPGEGFIINTTKADAQLNLPCPIK